MHMLVRHKVADFVKWKPVYDAHLSARDKAGLKEEHLFRNAEDPNEVLLLSRWKMSIRRKHSLLPTISARL